MLEFKLVKKEEIDTVIPLVELLHNAPTADVLKERFAEMVTQNYECVGVYLAQKLIGCAGLWIQTRHYSGRCLEPDHVIVHPDYQSQQVGEKLVQFFFEYAKAKGCIVTELNCYIPNTKAQAFWERMGYQKIGYHYILRPITA